jgi:hypothetical protein
MMTQTKTWLLLLLIFPLISASDNPKHENWGFFAHQRINRMAVFTLPPEMIVFYKKHIEYVTKHAIDPDKRRYISEQEAPRHYIDLDHFGTYPYENVPRKWLHALAKFTDVFIVNHQNDTLQLLGNDVVRYAEDSVTLKGDAISHLLQKDSFKIATNRYVDFVKNNINNQFYQLNWKLSLQNLDTLFQTQQVFSTNKHAFAIDILSEYGIVPWYLSGMLYRLTEAFKTMDKAKILKYSAEIGHYIGDAHVPLHTTQNYNGQLTNQVGIHGFWESRLPELFANNYNYFVGKANYIEDDADYFWDIVLTSHQLVDSVLLIEKDLTEKFPSDLKYCYETRNNSTVRTYCKQFSDAYHKELSGMVEQQMRSAILSVGTVWFTAWVNAGQPDLKDLEHLVIIQEDAPLNQESQKVKGRSHEN